MDGDQTSILVAFKFAYPLVFFIFAAVQPEGLMGLTVFLSEVYPTI